MTILDLSPAKTGGFTLSRGLIPVLAAALLLVLIGLPALMAPEQQVEQLDWRGNSAAVQETR
ncbi:MULTISPECIES: hypothetical protein [unclassified Leisingera]|uniref:hypothetical protein n=1 Tax=unclassified Leisingera TaxID=2614906 RepID=UPI0002E509AC|nr:MULTISPECIES: hypothetical protein [unclassified Leisingera]KIC19214.1 hypothetical protein RA21_01500 [Leisingera sp. ANG-DT]KIC26561.1 hypothetical protein RA23_02155 [Leisingera sp. ANG-S3]KIC53789.1 hypothetical protein RA22_08740 [Leisingera sp. ANG-S]KID10277.1 hypothetical protein GC1_00860 [Leisingera sp. ANG1]